jgi:hypothetical protein
VVVYSDRMVTMGGLTEFARVPKTAPITTSTVSPVAGDALTGARICKALRVSAPANVTVQQLAEVVGQEYARLRRHAPERDVFGSRGLMWRRFGSWPSSAAPTVGWRHPTAGRIGGYPPRVRSPATQLSSNGPSLGPSGRGPHRRPWEDGPSGQDH